MAAMMSGASVVRLTFEGLVHPFGSGDGHRVDDMNALFAVEAKYFLINNPGTDGDFVPGL
jgi:hypothetical protein